MSTAKGSRQWEEIKTPHGVTEFGTRNQALADYNAFRTKHKKVFGKLPKEIKFSDKHVTKRIKNEKYQCIEHKAILRTSMSLFRGKFVGVSLVSREEAMKIAVQLANEKFPKPKTSHKKERRPGIVKTMLGRIRSRQVV